MLKDFGTHAQCSAAIRTKEPLKTLSSSPGGSNRLAINVNNRGQVIGSLNRPRLSIGREKRNDDG
jgi:hypothetical protein